MILQSNPSFVLKATQLSHQCHHSISRIPTLMLHAASQNGTTPLKQAADAGNEGLLRLLIEHKAEIDAVSQVPLARIFASTLMCRANDARKRK